MVTRRNVPGTIARSAWGARYRDGFADRPLPVTQWWLHHSVITAPHPDASTATEYSAIRTLEQIGQERFGGGISYTVAITLSGRSYVGHSFWRRGAHTSGRNTQAAGICLVGNYQNVAPNIRALHEVARVMVAARRAGLATRHTLNGGHRDVTSTSCPGNAAYRLIPEINRIANQLWTSGDDVSRPPRAPRPFPAPPRLPVDLRVSAPHRL